MPDSSLLTDTVAALRGLGLDVEEQPEQRLTLGDGHTDLTFRAVMKRAVRPSTIASALAALETSSGLDPAVLISDHISSETGALLRARGILYADGSGNAWIRLPGALVFVDGRRAQAATPRTGPAGLTPAVLQVLFALLRVPADVDLPLRALGERAGVSHVSARQALAACEKRGWTKRLGRERHAVVDLDGMLTSWVEGFASRLGPDLETARATWVGASDIQSWAAGVDARCAWGDALLAGDLGAAHAGCDVRGTTGSVYVKTWNAETMRRLRLAPSRTGDLRVLNAFAPGLAHPYHPHVADPLLLLGELSGNPDERLDATRRTLREQVRARWLVAPSP